MVIGLKELIVTVQSFSPRGEPLLPFSYGKHVNATVVNCFTLKDKLTVSVDVDEIALNYNRGQITLFS